jgi:CDP-glycerol glycerophosphotransferase
VRFRPLDISRFSAVEVDFESDLERANTWLSSRSALGPLDDELR